MFLQGKSNFTPLFFGEIRLKIPYKAIILILTNKFNLSIGGLKKEETRVKFEFLREKRDFYGEIANGDKPPKLGRNNSGFFH